MARGKNLVILIGNVGTEPETRYSQSGTASTKIALATSESWKDKNGEQQERTEWHTVKFFGKLAEIVGEYVTKGRQLYVGGRIRTDKYKDKNGEDKYSTYIIGDEMEMLGPNPTSDNASPRSTQNRSSSAPAPSSNNRAPGGGGTGTGYNAGQNNPSPHHRNDDPFPMEDDIPFAHFDSIY